MKQVATRTLRTGNISQTTSMENANGVGRPSSGEVKTGTHLRKILLLVRSLQESLLAKTSYIVTLTQKPGQNLDPYFVS